MNFKRGIKIMSVYLIGYIPAMMLWDFFSNGQVIFSYELLIKAIVSGITFTGLWIIFTKKA